MSKIGKNIQAARLRAGLTQEELALRMGYKSKSTINKIEQGVNDIPQSKIVRFAEVLNTTPGELMGWVSEDTAKKNDQLAQLIVKMRSDADLLQLVKELADLTPEQRASVRSLLAAFGGAPSTPIKRTETKTARAINVDKVAHPIDQAKHSNRPVVHGLGMKRVVSPYLCKKAPRKISELVSRSVRKKSED